MKTATEITDSIGAKVQGLGGLLRCTVCGRETPLGSVAHKLANGWPTCHGLTMTWLTQAQLDAEGADKENPA